MDLTTIWSYNIFIAYWLEMLFALFDCLVKQLLTTSPWGSRFNSGWVYTLEHGYNSKLSYHLGGSEIKSRQFYNLEIFNIPLSISITKITTIVGHFCSFNSIQLYQDSTVSKHHPIPTKGFITVRTLYSVKAKRHLQFPVATTEKS